MKCSNLKAHLFYCLHVIDSPQCVCMSGIEDCFHYFFMCPLYTIERTKLFNNVQKLCSISLDSLLFGDSSLSLVQNLDLFKHVESYIAETERFV